jgi:hypothetical protein
LGAFGSSIIYETGGKIGIGKTSLVSMLDVAGNVNATAYCIGNKCIASFPGVNGSGAINNLTKWSDNLGNVTSSVIFETGGNIGIGKSNPSEKLDVNGKIKGTELCIGADCRSSWPYNSLDGSGAANNITLWSDSLGNMTSSLIYQAGGNIGIGTSSPGYKLEVVGGPIKATGGLIIDVRVSNPDEPVEGQMWLIT